MKRCGTAAKRHATPCAYNTTLPIERAYILQSPAIERQRTGAHTVRAGKLRPLGVLLPNRRKSPELATRHRPSEKSAGSFFFRFLPLARTSDFCAGRRISFAEASAALPQITPVPLPFSGLPDFSVPTHKNRKFYIIISISARNRTKVPSYSARS